MSNCPGPECGVFCILIVGIISRSALVLFSMLCARNYYYRKEPVFYVLTFYSNYLYGELSIFSYLYYCEIHLCRLICLYCTLTYNNYVIFIMLYFKLSSNFYFLVNIEYVPFWYFWTQFLSADKEIHNIPIFDHPQRSATTEIWITIGGKQIMARDILTQI